MRMLIAHDGSRCADAAIVDLSRAGLPTRAEATVLAVLEIWTPPTTAYDTIAVAPWERDRVEVDRIAEAAARSVSEQFPEWSVDTRTVSGVPAREIVRESEATGVDLVVVGSHGATAIGQFFLGSVSHKVATEAHCSVRVARGKIHESGDPVRLVICFKPAPSGDEAVTAVGSRNWPAATEVRLVTAVTPGRLIGPGFQPLIDELKQKHLAAARTLEAAGLAVSSIVVEGDPRSVVLDVAEDWGADTIFVGTRDLSRVGRWALGSVSGAILTRAHCSVEVARIR